MLGKPGMTRPVNSWYCAAEWTTMSPWQERITAISSMHCARCGNRSETSMPLLPYRLNVRLVPSSSRFGVDELILRLAELGRPLLAVELVQQRLGVERLQVARSAGHEQEDDRLRLGLACAAAWEPADCNGAARSIFLLQHGAERQRAEAAEGVAEKLAAIAGDADMFGHDPWLSSSRTGTRSG